MQGDIWLRVRDSCCHVSREQGAAIIRGLLLSDRFHIFVSVPLGLVVSDLVRRMKPVFSQGSARVSTAYETLLRPWIRVDDLRGHQRRYPTRVLIAAYSKPYRRKPVGGLTPAIG